MWRGTHTPSCKEGRDHMSPDTLSYPNPDPGEINGQRDGEEVVQL